MFWLGLMAGAALGAGASYLAFVALPRKLVEWDWQAHQSWPDRRRI